MAIIMNIIMDITTNSMIMTMIMPEIEWSMFIEQYKI